MKTKYNDLIALGMYLIGSLITLLPFKSKFTVTQYLSLSVIISFVLGMLNAIIQSMRKLSND